MLGICRLPQGVRSRSRLSDSPASRPALLTLGLAFLLAMAFADDARSQVAVPPAPQSATAADINRDFLDPTLDPDAWVAKFAIDSREVFAAMENDLLRFRRP